MREKTVFRMIFPYPNSHIPDFPGLEKVGFFHNFLPFPDLLTQWEPWVLTNEMFEKKDVLYDLRDSHILYQLIFKKIAYDKKVFK